MHNLSEQWRERGSLSKAGSWTSRARRGNKRRNDPLVPICPWKRLLLRFVRPQVNKILRAHHYCANYEHRAKSKECALGSLHRKFHSYVCRANAWNTMSRFHTRDNHRILLRRDVCTPLRNRRGLEMSNRRITRWTFISWSFRFFFLFFWIGICIPFLHSDLRIAGSRQLKCECQSLSLFFNLDFNSSRFSQQRFHFATSPDAWHKTAPNPISVS